MSKAVPRKKKTWVVVCSPEGKKYFLDNIEQLDDLRAQIRYFKEEGWSFKDHLGRTGTFTINNGIKGQTDLNDFYEPHDKALIYLIGDANKYFEDTQEYYNNFQ